MLFGWFQEEHLNHPIYLARALYSIPQELLVRGIPQHTFLGESETYFRKQTVKEAHQKSNNENNYNPLALGIVITTILKINISELVIRFTFGLVTGKLCSPIVC